MARGDIGKVRVRLVVDGSDLGQQIGDEVDRAEGRVSSKLGGMLKKAGRAGAVAGATALTKGLFDFAGFERSMNEIFTLLPGISNKAMGEMSGQVKGFAKEFRVLPDTVVPALYQSLSAGVPADNVFDFMATAQKAAKGGVTELTTAVDGITSVVNAYGADVVSATKASDLMFTAVRLGKTNFDELSRSLFNVTPTASALGVQFGDVTAALAALTAQGVPTSVATTQMRQLFVELSKEGSKTSSVFQDLAGKSFKDFVSAGGNTQQALQLLERHAADTGLGINDLFGSVEAGAAALALTGKGTEAFGKALAEMESSAGATDAAFAQMDRGLGKVWDGLKVRGKVALLDLGEGLVNAGSRAFDAFSQFRRLEQAAPILVGVGVAAAAFLVPPLLAAAAAAVAAAAPFVLVAAAVAGAAVLFHRFGGDLDFIGEKFGQVRAWAAEQWPAVQKIISGVVDFLTALWGLWGKHLISIAQAAWAQVWNIVSTAINLVKGVIELVLAVITGDWAKAWEAVQGLVRTAWDFIYNTIRNVGSTVAALVGALFDAARVVLKAALDGVVGYFKSLPGLILSALGDLGSLLWQAGKDLVAGLVRGIKAVPGAVVDALKGVVGGAVNSVKGFLGISSPSKVFAGIGRDTMEGLVLGVRSQERLLVAQLRRTSGIMSSVGGVWTMSGPSPTSSASPVTPHYRPSSPPMVPAAHLGPASHGAGWSDQQVDRLASAIGRQMAEAVSRQRIMVDKRVLGQVVDESMETQRRRHL
jgi:TP901 family phage tail tape measure protein